MAKKLFNLRQKSVQPKDRTEKIVDQHGPCVHFTFVPAEVLDNMPAFRQWRLSAHQKPSPKSNVLSQLVVQGLKIH